MLSAAKCRARLHAQARARQRYGLRLAPIDLDRIDLAIAFGGGETLHRYAWRGRRLVRLVVRRQPVLFVFEPRFGVVSCLPTGSER